MIMKKIFPGSVLFVLLAYLISGRSYAFDLPAPADLISSYKLTKHNIKVVEPHQTTKTHYSYVEYSAVSIDELLSRLFGDQWRSEGAQIVFYAQDGYRSAVTGSKLARYRAYLAYARGDNKPFFVDNIDQGQKAIQLGPYYLIWDNLDNQELITHGAYDWPYQVTRIDLQGKDMQDKLRPRNLSADIEIGMLETEKYCLNCHGIRGMGGQKYPMDLIEAASRLRLNDLKAWIDAPSAIKPGTTMPSLNRMLAPEERKQVIARIVHYLYVMKKEPAFVEPPTAPAVVQ